MHFAIRAHLFHCRWLRENREREHPAGLPFGHTLHGNTRRENSHALGANALAKQLTPNGIGQAQEPRKAGRQADGLEALLGREALAEIDPVDRVQSAFVVHCCRECASLSDAGRKLYAASRQKRASTNDADRLRKYLDRYGVGWDLVRSQNIR